jgi:hypothetical protein
MFAPLVGKETSMIDLMLGVIFQLIVCYMLIFKPLIVAKLLGGIYWRMRKLTALGGSDENKKYFFTESPRWFRVLGILLAGLLIVSVYAQLAKLQG